MNIFKASIIIFTILFSSSNLFASTLDDVKNRGFINCGISDPHPGFADVNSKNEWIGFDIDMCKAISVAIFGDPSKVNYVLTSSRSRFPLLAGGEVDLLSRMTTWTFSRDVNLGFEFTDINFYDGQSFMYDTSLNIENAVDFDGSSICLISGSTMEYNVKSFFDKNNISYNPILVEFDDEAYESFVSGRCDIYTHYITELSKKRITINNTNQYSIYSDLISKEPLGMLVRQGDDHWRDIISWSFKVMVIAEEFNITSSNIDEFTESDNNEILSLLGVNSGFGDMIELDEYWSYNIIKLIGNYAEVYDKNFGPKTIANLKRGLNNLYTNNGLLYSPPFR